MNSENNQNGFKMTEIGLLPEEWEVVRLGNVVKTFSGGTPRRDKSEYWGGEIDWLKSGRQSVPLVPVGQVGSLPQFAPPQGTGLRCARMLKHPVLK